MPALIGPAPILLLTRKPAGLVAVMKLWPSSYVRAEDRDLHATGDSRVVEIAAHDRLPMDFDMLALSWAFQEASGLLVASSLEDPADFEELTTFARWWSTSPGFVVELHVSTAGLQRWIEFAKAISRPDTPVRILFAGCASQSSFPSGTVQ